MEGDFVASRSDDGTWTVIARVTAESEAKIEIVWEHGETDAIPLPLPRSMAIWRAGSLGYRSQTEPAVLAGEIADDPTRLLARILREEGPTLHRKALRARALQLGLPEELFAGDKSWWTRHFRALTELPDIASGTERFTLTWSSAVTAQPPEPPESARTNASQAADPPSAPPDGRLAQLKEQLDQSRVELAKSEKKRRLLEADAAAARMALEEQQAKAERDRAESASLAARLAQTEKSAAAEAERLEAQRVVDRQTAEMLQTRLDAAVERANALETELRAAVAAGRHESLAPVRQARIDGARVVCSILADLARDTATYATSIPEFEALYKRVLARAAIAGIEPIESVGSTTHFDPALHHGQVLSSTRVVVDCPGFAYRDGDELVVLERALVRELT